MEKIKRKTILLGEGVNQHTLYGEFKTEKEVGEFLDVEVLIPSELRHETPARDFAEHYTIELEAGMWQQGKQVEYNPFEQRITAVWD
jgi:hypothetical protein